MCILLGPWYFCAIPARLAVFWRNWSEWWDTQVMLVSFSSVKNRIQEGDADSSVVLMREGLPIVSHALVIPTHFLDSLGNNAEWHFRLETINNSLFSDLYLLTFRALCIFLDHIIQTLNLVCPDSGPQSWKDWLRASASNEQCCGRSLALHELFSIKKDKLRSLESIRNV